MPKSRQITTLCGVALIGAALGACSRGAERPVERAIEFVDTVVEAEERPVAATDGSTGATDVSAAMPAAVGDVSLNDIADPTVTLGRVLSYTARAGKDSGVTFAVDCDTAAFKVVVSPRDSLNAAGEYVRTFRLLTRKPGTHRVTVYQKYRGEVRDIKVIDINVIG